MLTVYDIPVSPYAQKVKLALLEKGVDFRAIVPDVDNPDVEFLAASPRREVPAFVDGEVNLFDSSIIVEYIEDRWPDPPLLPSGAAERARVRTIEEVCDTVYDAVNWAVAEVLWFKRAEGEKAESLLAHAKDYTASLNRRLERELQNREWLNGERFGFGDIVAYPFVNGAAAMGNKPEAGGRLEAWLKSMRSRPSAQRLKQDVVSGMSRFANRATDVAQGRHRRRYRDHRLEWLMSNDAADIVFAGLEKNDICFTPKL
jgi:glutathione S-transferase